MDNIALPAKTPFVDQRRHLKWMTVIICSALMVAWLALGSVMLREPERDYATTRLSADGLFSVTINPDTEPIPINAIHTWVLHVETPSGERLDDALIRVDGDMPEHGHGLPTRPEVTAYLGNGDYRVEGMKFQMPGWWVMDFDITVDGQSDLAQFNLLLK